MLAAVAAVGCGVEPEDTTPRDTDGDGTPESCADLTSAQTAGPFYPGIPVSRVDIRGGVEGVTLELDLQVVQQGTCAPVVGAEVDLWGANADGDYSGYADFDTVGEDWMRGMQVTDEEGVAKFTAIIPGSYPGRAIHLHVKVRPPGGSELTTQIYFADDLMSAVLDEAAYAGGARLTSLAGDNFYEGDTLVTLSGDATVGFSGEVAIVV
jgi:protocatechuate 3,4-dioxygenase beta subunit